MQVACLRTEMERAAVPLLYVVWIDIYWGNPEDWVACLPAKPLSSALDEAADLRRRDWVVKILPEGRSPRADGLLQSPGW